MKNRLSVLDLRRIISELKSSITGLRLQNVYDIENKTYLLKFARPDEKVFVVVESGQRVHPTEFIQDKPSIPAPFTVKLRKHLRSRRLTRIEQVGVDRVIDFVFGENETAQHLFVELYAKGNIVLTDSEYNITALLRHHKREGQFAVGHPYPLHLRRQPSPPPDTDRIRQILQSAKPKSPLRQVLSYEMDYGTALVDHCIFCAGFNPTTKLSSLLSSINHHHYQDQDHNDDINNNNNENNSTDEKSLNIKNISQKLSDAFKNQGEVIMSQVAQDKPMKGYIILKDGKSEDDGYSAYEESLPIILEQFRNRSVIEFNTFGEALDKFFTGTEALRAEQRRHTEEASALRRLDRIKEEQEQRIHELHNSQEHNREKAMTIENMVSEVEAAIEVVAGGVASGTSWDELDDIIEKQRIAENPTAIIIDHLDLAHNSIVLNLPSVSEPDVDMLVEVDIGLSAYANASRYYSAMKQSAKKEEKTKQVNSKVIRQAEKKAQKAIDQAAAKTSSKARVQSMRKRFWFEKFHWFISSENYIVVCGQDAQQNEMLVRRYLKTGDVYVHADVHGAATCIVKNPSPDKRVPPITISEAGALAVCRSAAWDNKISVSAWWVYSSQVSKTAPSGEYLPRGSFMIRGKKNPIPQPPLVMGLGVLFRVDDSCVEHHVGERRPRDYGSDSIEDDGADYHGVIPAQKEEEYEDDHDGEEYNDANGIKNQEIGAEGSNDSSGDKPVVINTATMPTRKQRSGFSIEQSRKEAKKKKQEKRSGKQNNVDNNNSNNTNNDNNNNNMSKSGKKMKKGKLKKMKKKYKDQDEEERKIRMQLLGHKVSDEEKEKEEEKQTINEIQEHDDYYNNNNNNNNNNNEDENKDKNENENMNQSEDKNNNNNNNNNQNENNDQEDDDEEEEDEHHDEENDNDGPEDSLDVLTGKPREDDEMLFSLAVCAPYSALQNYKYRVKINPGNSKRGQVSKQARSLFLNDKEATSTEKDLIQNIPDDDVTRVLVSNAKLSAPGLSQLQKKQKKQKQRKKKKN